MIEATTPRAAPYRRDRAPWGLSEIAAVLLVTLVALVAVFTVLSLVVAGLNIDRDIERDPTGATILLIGQLALNVIAVSVAAGFSLGK